MAWYDPTTWISTGGGVTTGDGATVKSAKNKYQNKYGNLSQMGGQAADFGRTGEAGFGQLGKESADLRAQLGRYASGQESLSAEQLRQGLQQNQAAQQSMAAGARPQNAAMAARTAAMNMGRMGAGLSGQQAMAGIAERQAATQSLGNMIGQGQQMNLQAALGGRGQAIDAYGNVLNAKVGIAGQPSGWDKMLGAAIPAAGLVAAMSDRRLKEKVVDGEKDADDFIKGLRAYKFEYKDPKHGAGERVGIMAQDLEKSKAGRTAVVETPHGKAVHGGHLATAIAATLPGLAKRLSKLEKDRK